MKKVIALASLTVCALGFSPLLGQLDFPNYISYPDKLEINNRILIKINGSVISVRDVVRRMDLIFFQQYPDFLHQPALRYQFYKENWRNFLQTVIDDQLVLSDAKEKKVDVTDGEIRERLEESLGPDVVFNLEAIGLSMEEALQLVRTELIVRKMKGSFVHAKAFADVHPRMLRERYEKMIHEQPPESRYIYQVLSFKADDEKASLALAQDAFEQLALHRLDPQLIASQYSLSSVKVNLSDLYTRSSKEISEAHKTMLDKLSNDSFSEPVLKRGVAYVFYLKEFQKSEPPPFAELAPRIKQELLQERVMQYEKEYKERLRKKYGITEQFLSQLIPDTTQPFALR